MSCVFWIEVCASFAATAGDISIAVDVHAMFGSSQGCVESAQNTSDRNNTTSNLYRNGESLTCKQLGPNSQKLRINLSIT